MSHDSPRFVTYDAAFADILGPRAEIQLALENDSYPWAHEACVFVASTNDLFITSNRITHETGEQEIRITKVNIGKDSLTRVEIPTTLPMANGGVNYRNGVLFCVQGSKQEASGLWLMETHAPHQVTPVLEHFNGLQFNSPNDVVVHRDGSIWFTDPIYGFEQGFRPAPRLPNQVYRFDPDTNSIRAMADGFGRPNGISFSPDQSIVYITDTDQVHGDGTTDPLRPASIYAFDVITRNGQPFLANRRLFAWADSGIPDGIKCDEDGNVYSGCGDGIHIWSPGGTLLGKILIPGGVSNFCFCRRGEIMASNETRLWRVKISPTCTGCLVKL